MSEISAALGMDGTVVLSPAAALFDLATDPSDVGTVFEATAANSPGWDMAAVLLKANSPNVRLMFETWFGTLVEWPIEGVTGLAEATIASVKLEFSQISFVPGTWGPFGVSTDVSFAGQVRIYGLVPEPGSATAVLARLAALLKRRGRGSPRQ